MVWLVMFAPANFALQPPSPFVVGDEGVSWRNAFHAFRPVPAHGFSRKNVAALAGLHPRSIKRIEKRSKSLATGRRSMNQRVLFYDVDSVVAFLDEDQLRVDLLSAISLGFPLGTVRPDRFGYHADTSRAFRPKGSALLPVPVGTAQQIAAAWENWRVVNHQEIPDALPMPVVRNPALEPHTALALAAFTDAVLPRSRLVEWARTCGHSSRHIEYQVAEVARILRERLTTTEGQLLLALLFRSGTPASTQPLEPAPQQFFHGKVPDARTARVRIASYGR